MPQAQNHILQGLYAVTPEDHLLPRLSAQVTSALEGGVRLIQFRNKLASPPLRRALASELLRLCRAFEAKLMINDDIDLALEINADGVHLGRNDGDWATARTRLPQPYLLGVSCYGDLQLAHQGALIGADYLAFGAMFPSLSKPHAAIASLDILQRAKKELALPIAAIGGITLTNAPHVINAGADMTAVISDLFDAMDIRSRAASFLPLFPSQPKHS